MTKEYRETQGLYLDIGKQLKKLRITSATLNPHPEAKMHIEAAIKHLTRVEEMLSEIITTLREKS